MSDAYRVETDSLGEMKVPAEAYWGPQTQRAVENFGGLGGAGGGMPREFIEAHVLLKKAAAVVNRDLGLLKAELAEAIIKAADEVLAGTAWAWEGNGGKGQFPVDVYQTGSGTSTNMNVNEVLASRANELLGGKQGERGAVHPNDHVNMGQSSNDTVPTSLQVMTHNLINARLRPAIFLLLSALNSKAKEFWPIIKTGRTHLQDATPIRLGQEFGGFVHQVAGIFGRGFIHVELELKNLPIGGTAVGTGINTHPEFATRVCATLTKWAGSKPPFKETHNHFGDQATLDTAVAAHAVLKSLAVSLTKIANDIRWMGSGPRAGLGEIELPAVQPGSSIMPGKVNPVMAESLLMVCQRVIGNDAALTAAATQCNFELAMSLPLAAKCLHESITLLARGCENFAKKCVDGIKATPRGPELVERGLMLATALAPVIGYDKAAAIAKEAAASGRTIREVAREKSGLSEERLKELLDAGKMVEPGSH